MENLQRPTSNPLKIGELAEQAGVGVETVRFYERQGLLAEPPRLPSGYRIYPRDAVARLRFVRRAKELGFTLKEIGELLALQADPHGACDEVRGQLAVKIADIEERITDLQQMHDALLEMAERCDQRTGEGCAFLEALDSGRRE